MSNIIHKYSIPHIKDFRKVKYKNWYMSYFSGKEITYNNKFYVWKQGYCDKWI